MGYITVNREIMNHSENFTVFRHEESVQRLLTFIDQVDDAGGDIEPEYVKHLSELSLKAVTLLMEEIVMLRMLAQSGGKA